MPAGMVIRQVGRGIASTIFALLWLVVVIIGIIILTIPHLAMCICDHDGVIDSFMEGMDVAFDDFKEFF